MLPFDDFWECMPPDFGVDFMVKMKAIVELLGVDLSDVIYIVMLVREVFKARSGP